MSNAQRAQQKESGSKQREYCLVELFNCPGSEQSREQEHIHSYSDGGGNGEENTAQACRSCNRLKSNMLPKDFRLFVAGICASVNITAFFEDRRRGGR
ncbi:MAG: HNH endonuclease [Pseudomonas sp.]|uniref:HNH endonuclease n=1 Tax=Pseudomonas sp. TaxID=306 RepID=UPI00339ACBA1